MKIFRHAESVADDPIEYVLLNLQGCSPSLAERKFSIDYYRNEEPSRKKQIVRRTFTFEEIEAAHPGLCGELVSLFTDSGILGSQKPAMVQSLSSFVFGTYSDLRLYGPVTTKYPYVVQVLSVSNDAEEHSFRITSVSFDVLDVSSQGIPRLSTSSYLEQPVNAAQIDNIWPNGSKLVPLMETLGYDSYKIAEQLNRSLATSEATLDVGGPVFDITFDE